MSLSVIFILLFSWLVVSIFLGIIVGRYLRGHTSEE